MNRSAMRTVTLYYATIPIRKHIVQLHEIILYFCIHILFVSINGWVPTNTIQITIYYFAIWHKSFIFIFFQFHEILKILLQFLNIALLLVLNFMIQNLPFCVLASISTSSRLILWYLKLLKISYSAILVFLCNQKSFLI